MGKSILIDIKWIDLNVLFQTFIIHKLLISFGKMEDDVNDYTFKINNIRQRFMKQSCMVNLYCENFVIKGICISWQCNNFLYLDKFFTFSSKKGIGSLMLNAFIQKYYENENENETVNNMNKLIWRTDKSTSKFYLKHPKVIEYFEVNHHLMKHHLNNNERKLYLGVGKTIWEYEDIYDLNIKSCFA